MNDAQAESHSQVSAFRVDGRVALVTGAGRGIGRGAALALAGAGAEVVLMTAPPPSWTKWPERSGSAAVARQQRAAM